MSDLATYADVILGDRTGYAAVAFGRKPYFTEKGRYSHREWTETRYAWPAERDMMIRSVMGQLDIGEPVDVYVCPVLRYTDKRRKGDALPPAVLWVDLDGEPADSALWATLNPVIVSSGQPGHRHGYVPLSEPVDLGTHKRLQAALRDRLGGDDKIADNDLLRLPGTRNHKTDPPGVVAFESTAGRVWEPGELAELLGVDLEHSANLAECSTVTAPDAEPAPDPLPGRVRAMLDRYATPEDVSAAHHAIVGACKDSGLTLGQAVSVLARYGPSVEKYGNRLAEEVARSWGKVTETDAATFTPVDLGQPAGGSADARKPNPAKYFAGKAGLKAATLAADVLAFGPLAEGIDDRIWRYHGGVWVPDKHAVRNRAAALLGERHRSYHASTAEGVIRSRVPTIDCEPVERFINFRNGLLDWRTGELHPHTPEVLATVQLGVPYDSDAECPEFEKFLQGVVPADMVRTVWELIGYLMYSGNPLHKAVMCTGNGRNGKGTLLRVILAVLGAGNVTTVSLHNLVNTRFSTASLFGKLANIAGDIDGGYLENTATFKAITGGDMISAEHKGRDRFDFTPWAVPVFSANKIPASADTTTGYLSRWLVVPFPHDFTGREDRALDTRLQAPGELAGIAACGIRALPRLLERGDFELTESAEAAREEFTRRVDQVRTWLADCTEPDPEHWTYRTELYEDYKAWANRDGHKPVKASEFYDRLESGGQVGAAKVAGYRGYKGIRVTDTAGVLRAVATHLPPAPTPAPDVTSENTDLGADGADREAAGTFTRAGAREKGCVLPAPSAPTCPPDADKPCDLCESAPTRVDKAGNRFCRDCAPHIWKDTAA